ncbi:MAG: glycosyl transferase [Streptococcaceae bacterium]|jgi:hypothetical protein|nr:glycosyl transferase [Streptococcaceae bacterium]
MIPKKIHYCWFGGNPMPEKIKKCLASWRQYCPDYEIIEWNETTYDINKNTYLRAAYDAKMWAFVSDFARLDVVHEFGGIYLDSDVELIRSLDTLLDNQCFLAMENLYGWVQISTGLGFGAEKGHAFVKENMALYLSEDSEKKLITGHKTNVEYTQELLETKGYFVNEDKYQKFEGVLILPTDCFNPYDPTIGAINTTERTYGIHWYETTWKNDNKVSKWIRRRLVVPAKKKIQKLVGDDVYQRLKYWRKR